MIIRTPIRLFASSVLFAALVCAAVSDADTIRVRANQQTTASNSAFHKSQYEPVVRRNHAAMKDFDSYVDARLAAVCAKPGSIARYGSAWRYEYRDLAPTWQRASANVETDIAVLGRSYAPQDGRYRFDFSKVKYSFDKARVDAAITQACHEHKAQGKTFLARIDVLVATGDWAGAHEMEMRAMAWPEPVRLRLQKVLEAEQPESSPILVALMNGQPAN